MTTHNTEYRAPIWPDQTANQPSGIYHNAIRFVLENRLHLRSPDEIAEAILKELGEYKDGLLENEIHRLAKALTARRWQQVWLH